MKIKYLINNLLCIVITIIPIHFIYSQPATLTLNKIEAGNIIKEASQSVTLSPGFSYKATQGETFIGRISTNQNEGNNNLVNYNVAITDISVEPDFQPSIRGSLDVSPTGAATYSIPISLPPGTMGMQPNLAIVYNSQAGNGILGLKWGLSGLSAISRSGKNLFSDNTVDGISYSDNAADDALTLDGNRLVKASDGTFRTKVETFSRITANGSGTTSWFKVEYKNGQVAEYGNTSDSRLYASGKANPLAWRINKISDPNGNYMTFIYKTENGESFISTINYTGNTKTSLATYNKITFNYKKRSDISSRYVSGGTLSQANLLTSIVLTCEGSYVKEFKMDYDEQYAYIGSRLTTVTEHFDSNNSSSLSVSWGLSAKKKKIGTPDTYIKNIPDGQIYTGDFNGDGLDDVLTFNAGTWQLMNRGVDAPVTVSLSNISSSINTNDVYVGDFNGDGKADLMVHDKKNDGEYKIYFSTGTGFDHKKTIAAGCAIVGDFAAIGKDQIIINAKETYVIATTGSPFTITQYITYYCYEENGSITKIRLNGLNTRSQSGKLYVSDIDGDGIMEFGFITSNTLKIYTVKNKITPTLLTTLSDLNINNIQVADVDGDGRTEIISVQSTTKTDKNFVDKFDYCTYNGSSFGKVSHSMFRPLIQFEAAIRNPNKAKGYEIIQCSSDNTILFKDINGDGKADVLQIFNVHKPKGAIWANKKDWRGIYEFEMYPIDNTVWANVPEEKQTYCQYIISGEGGIREWIPFNELNAISGFGDFNGDGNTDVMLKPLLQNYTFFDVNVSQDYLVNAITDNSINENIKISYVPASNKTVHTKGSGSTFPYCDYAGPLYLVSSVEVPDGIGGKNKVEYAYAGLTLHRQGRGLLGFKSVTCKDNTRELVTKTHYKETSETKSWVPYYTIVTTTDKAKVSSIGRRYTYSLYDRLQSDTVRDYLNNRNYYTTYVYDSYGNPTSVITTYSQNGISKTTTSSYETKGSWVPNKLTQSTISNAYGGTASYAPITRYTYDGLGNLLTIIQNSGKSKALTTTFATPNSYGLPSSVTLSASGEENRTNSFVYDTKYRFIKQKKNELGQTIECEYDPKTGNMLSATNLTTGLIQSFRYNVRGELQETTGPDGNITKYYRKKADDNAPQYAAYYTLVEVPGQPYLKIYYDKLGREIRRETQGFSSKVVVDRTYDAKGVLKSVSDPYKSSAGASTTYGYDKYGRLSSSKYQSLETKYSYGEGTITTTDPSGNTVTQRKDQLGNSIHITDANNLTLYRSYAGGQMSHVYTAGSDKIISMGYDDCGRQNKLTDLDAGSIDYGYNAFGELVSQKDARSNQYTMKYDNLGRLKTKTTPLGTTSYEYYTETGKASHGLLKTVTGPDNMKEQYEYDPLGRLIAYTDNIEGEAFKTSYGYDVYGNITLMSYPSGFTVENRYNKAGYQYEIRDASSSQSIWKLQETNEMGAIRKVVNGNGLTTEYVYNAYNALTDIKTGSIQHLNYTPNANNPFLIDGRKDIKKSQTESFKYSRLEWLQSYQINNGSIQSMIYYDNGNIETKPGTGSYKYDPQKIHAVQSITGEYTAPAQTVAYNGLNKVSSITEGNYKYNFQYGSDAQRRKMREYTSFSLTLDKSYTLNYEREKAGVTTREYHYIPTPSGMSAVWIKENGNQGNFYYLCSDHLGSITAVANSSGGIVTEYGYDAWGRRRHSGNWNDYNPSVSSLLSRGYTGHEHLDKVGLINMNGRLYDPRVGRMLSPDNLVPNPYSLQGYNRYSYVFNNPMSYADPDGENPLAWIAGGAVLLFKFLYDGAKANDDNWNPIEWDWKKATYTVGYGSNTNTLYGGIGWDSNYLTVMTFNPGLGIGFGNLQQLEYLNSAPIRSFSDSRPEGIYAAQPGFWETFRAMAYVNESFYQTIDMFYVFGTNLRTQYGYHLDGSFASPEEYRIAAMGTFMSVMGTGMSVGAGGNYSLGAAKGGGKELYNFGKTAAQHMTEPGRKVPLQLMDDVLKTTKGLPDPGGSRALMHYSPMWKNGTQYNLEILYDQTTNSIWHFKYTQKALGPLPLIP